MSGWDEGKHRDVAAAYLGLPEDLDYDNSGDAKLAHANLNRVAHLDASVPLLASHVLFSCVDTKGWCHKEHLGSTKDNYVILCENFWYEPTTDSKYDIYKGLDKKYITMKCLQNVDLRVIIHELMHTSLIQQGVPAYGAEVLDKWIRDSKTKTIDVLINADSYAVFVLACFWKEKFGFLPPPDQESQWHESPECHHSDYSVYFDGDVAKTHIENFCKEAAAKYTPGNWGYLEKSYETGKPDEQTWKLAWSKEARKDPVEIRRKCEENFGKILNDCQPDNNFWKQGGAITWYTEQVNDAEYKFQLDGVRERPTPVGEPWERCGV
ncbi:hypothetical protein EJ04DRAFT_599373 [Polyplosphaeria fusca]|uniref:Uncharacterized protein n=1 Tax=Polyplosphaeria fusca TaxID=682080 RepID=A0A9P4UVU7_9PLEO|nr:hypothetical protein EJ04DRAFT_599373 [Polyplosphaeria fusca]